MNRAGNGAGCWKRRRASKHGAKKETATHSQQLNKKKTNTRNLLLVNVFDVQSHKKRPGRKTLSFTFSNRHTSTTSAFVVRSFYLIYISIYVIQEIFPPIGQTAHGAKLLGQRRAQYWDALPSRPTLIDWAERCFSCHIAIVTITTKLHIIGCLK